MGTGTAFVTGASQGIGREIARTLVECGNNVTLAARSDGIYETESLIDNPDRTLPIKTDVTDEESVKKAIEKTVDNFDSLDILVNNAGIAGPTAPIEEIDQKEWERTMDVNVGGMFLTTKHAAPHLRESNQGSVVNIASISGKRPLVNRSPYTTSKMAVIGFTRTLAFELGKDDVTVNAICPGATQGPRIEAVIEKQAIAKDVDYETAKREIFTDDAALGRLVNPEDIAEMVAFLVSDSGFNMTAQDINIDAGATWY